MFVRQLSFSRLFGGKKFATDEEAKRARDLAYMMFRKHGITCRRWVLPDQWNKYSGFGQFNPKSNSSVCDVYKLTVTFEHETDLDKFRDIVEACY